MMAPLEPPALICLNFQRWAFSSPHRSLLHAGMLNRARACIDWARHQTLPLIHVHSFRPGSRREHGHGALPGFEPLPTEILAFKSSASLFQSRELAAAGPLRDALVIGFTAARDCIAAAVDAQRMGVRLLFVADAIASPDLTDLEPSAARGIQAVLEQFAALITTDELIGYGMEFSREPARRTVNYAKG